MNFRLKIESINRRGPDFFLKPFEGDVINRGADMCTSMHLIIEIFTTPLLYVNEKCVRKLQCTCLQLDAAKVIFIFMFSLTP